MLLVLIIDTAFLLGLLLGPFILMATGRFVGRRRPWDEPSYMDNALGYMSNAGFLALFTLSFSCLAYASGDHEAPAMISTSVAYLVILGLSFVMYQAWEESARGRATRALSLLNGYVKGSLTTRVLWERRRRLELRSTCRRFFSEAMSYYQVHDYQGAAETCALSLATATQMTTQIHRWAGTVETDTQSQDAEKLLRAHAVRGNVRRSIAMLRQGDFDESGKAIRLVEKMSASGWKPYADNPVNIA